MTIQTITRKELAYVLTMEQYETLYERIITYMRPDSNGINGLYTVTTLYFDNLRNKIYHEAKNKTRNEKQLRLKVYDDANKNSNAFFEIKQQTKDTINKSWTTLPLHEAYRYLHEGGKNGLATFNTSNIQAFKEINDYRATYKLLPNMIINHDRHALYEVGNEGVRMTFDFNVRCRNYDLFLEHGAYGKACIHPDFVILEVKVPDQLPRWLIRILQELDCHECPASKYNISFETLYHSTINDDKGKSYRCDQGQPIKQVAKRWLMKLAKEIRIST